MLMVSSVHRKYTKIDYLRGHKTNLNKFKRIEIMQNIHSDHMESS